ncbi:FAD-dependent oxidoreductase [Bacillus sp. P14.5]|uniref:FAD-dependent oxidoreductase n=1 Tax=Bacillus sp. P14.5 TaxID=1983400 RepID=UPI000DE8B262|nr:FAD-dependent oxidoreductase [Bacillus sp. P14.5]
MHKVILVGGGHAHLHCLKQIRKEPLSNTRFILVSPSKYQYYSGMFSGFAEGIYPESEIRVNLEELCRKSGVEFIQDSAEKILISEKKLILGNGCSLSFSHASFDIGSSTKVNQVSGVNINTVKPNYRVPSIIKELQNASSPIIVGGGAAGVELCLALLQRKKKLKMDGTVTLISSNRLISNESASASKRLEKECRKKGARLFTGEHVEEVSIKVLKTNKQTLSHSGVLFVTGPSSFPIFKESGITATKEGYMTVSDTLQSTSHPFILGAGDCVTLLSHPRLAKNGVYAVRQGPVLWENIKRILSNRPRIEFSPQKRYLSILSTGGKQAMLLYGDFYWHGRLPWKIKSLIDKKFLKQYL